MIRLAQIAPMGRAGIATVSPRRRKIFPRFCGLMFLRCSGGGGGFFILTVGTGFFAVLAAGGFITVFFRGPDRYFFARQRHRFFVGGFLRYGCLRWLRFFLRRLAGRGFICRAGGGAAKQKDCGDRRILPMMSMFRNFPRAASILSSGDRVPLFGKRLVNNVKFVPAGSGAGLESARRMDHIADLQRNGTGRVR